MRHHRNGQKQFQNLRGSYHTTRQHWCKYANVDINKFLVSPGIFPFLAALPRMSFSIRRSSHLQ